MPDQKGMKSTRYSEDMNQEIKQMIAAGQTQQQIAEHFGLKDRIVVHQIMKCEREKHRNP
jgi:hypothetical protein